MSAWRVDSSERRAKSRVFTHRVLHNGCSFRATEEMAAIFLRRATATLNEAGTELVPLSHSGGVDLLLIASEIVWSVTRIEVGVVAPIRAQKTVRTSALRVAS